MSEPVSPITLETPITRGKQKITQVTVTKPNSGALRGASLAGLIRLEVNDLHIVLPRVTTPNLTTQEVTALDPVDLMALGLEVAGFFASQAVVSSATPTA